jgi:hypothetical protein
VWWRDRYEDRVIKPWDGEHQRADEVVKMRFPKSFCVGFLCDGARTCARAPHKISPMVDIAQRKGVRECSRNKPSGEKLAHDTYLMLSSEFHDSVIIQ